MTQDMRASGPPLDGMVAAELEQLRRRVRETRAEQRRLRNTLGDIARESEVRLGCVCSECDEAYMIIKDRVMSCPSCANRTGV